MSSAGKSKPPRSANPKVRLDALVVARGLAESESKAASLIMAGEVFSGQARLTKPGELVKPDIPLEIKLRKGHAWVSRGGLKLAHGLKHFAVNVEKSVALDIGASTGGFTDVLLHNGAAKVYAVDVGYGELAWKVQSDPRVVVMDRTNARHLTRELIAEPLNIIVCDASFTSLKQVLPAGMGLAAKGAMLIALIKPQFEVPKHQVGEGGIITDAAVHEAVCRDIENFITGLQNWHVLGITASPILGQEGNKEFLIAAKYDTE